MNVFVTGGTGFLGREILTRILRLDATAQVTMLVRAESQNGADKRVVDLMRRLFAEGEAQEHLPRVRAIAGDLGLPGLGLSEIDRLWVVENVNSVLHLGANTDFASHLDLSRRYNVEGTRELLTLALDIKANGQFSRFDYVSTAFVAGTKQGAVSEDDLMRGQSFANAYEQSKYEAELVVRDFKSALPLVVHRPSVVVGQSKNGFTPHFKVLYWPLKLLSKGLLPVFPINRRTKLDIVPVDFVADAMFAIMRDPETIGLTFHLTAGQGQETRLVEVVKDSYRYAGVKPIPMIPGWVFDFIRTSFLRRFLSEDVWMAIEMASPYRQYIYGTGVRFENSRTREVLERHGIRAPRWSEYSRSILEFCRVTKWGRKLPRPENEYHRQVVTIW